MRSDYVNHPVLTRSRFVVALEAIFAQWPIMLGLLAATAVVHYFNWSLLNYDALIIEPSSSVAIPEGAALYQAAVGLIGHVIMAIAGAYGHHYALQGVITPKGEAIPPLPMNRLITFVVIAMIFGMVFVVFNYWATADLFTQLRNGSYGAEASVQSGMLGNYALLISVILTCLIGTIFPAVIDGKPASLAAAFSRGGFWRLLLQFLLMALVTLLLVAIIAGPMVALVQYPAIESFTEQGFTIFEASLKASYQPAFFYYNLAMVGLYFYITMLFAVTLTEHYVRKEKEAFEGLPS